MANDSGLYIRRALVTALQGTTPAGASVYGPGVPANPPWPRIQVPNPDVEPLRAQCLDGVTFDVIVHTFAKGPDESGCAELNRVVASVLDGKGRPLPDAPFPARIRRLTWLRSQIIRDTDEASAWHGLVTFQGSVSS